MNVDSFLISEYATTTSGRLTIVNTFNRLRGPGPRWGLPLLYLSSVTHAHITEVGPHRGEIRLVNAAREQLLPKPHLFDFEFSADMAQEGMPLRHQGVYMIAGLAFSAPGPYAFELHIDEVYAAAATLYVLRTDAPPGR